MAQRMEHYVQLVSNASMNIYPENVISEFTTQFAQSLELSGEWHVAMHSCSYHRNWVNVPNSRDFSYKIEISQWNEHGNTSPITNGIIYLPAPGNYSSTQSLIDAINSGAWLYNNQDRDHVTVACYVRDFIEFSFNSVTQKVSVTWKSNRDMENGVVSFEPTIQLADMLGHRQENTAGERQLIITVGTESNRIPAREGIWPLPPFNKETMRSCYEMVSPANVVDVYNIFIYSDVVDSTRLGDADAAYFHMVPVQGKEGDYIHFVVQNLIYKRVVNSCLPSIHIKVADFSGERVKFNHGSGEFTCMLHFKKVG